MTWQRAPVAAAVEALLAGIDPSVGAYATPPETLNPPVYVCGYPRSVTYGVSALGTDLAELVVIAFAGPLVPDTLDHLLDAARKAFDADQSLGGVVQSAVVVSQSNWRRLSVAGAETLAADLTVEVRM